MNTPQHGRWRDEITGGTTVSLDQQGLVWLSNPWIAAFAVVAAVGLLLWCHLSVAADVKDRSVEAPVRGRRTPQMRRPTTVSSRGLSCQVAVERERRDANRQCVA